MTYKPDQEVWWLNTSFWLVQPAIAIRYCYTSNNNKHWEIEPTGGGGCPLVVPENELFLNRVDAYKEGVARLAKTVKTRSLFLDKALTVYGNFIRGIDNW